MAHDVFISYSSEDKLAADALCGALEAARIRCWIAPRDVVPARSYSGEITRAINNSRVMVLIFSEHSNVSAAVLSEVELAANARIHILNFRVDDSPLGDDLRFYLQRLHWFDALTPPIEQHHARLVQMIQRLLAPSSTPKEEELPPPPPAPREVVPRKPGGLRATKFPLLRIVLLVALVAGGAVVIWRLIDGGPPPPHPTPTPTPTPIAAKSSPTATPESSPTVPSFSSHSRPSPAPAVAQSSPAASASATASPSITREPTRVADSPAPKASVALLVNQAEAESFIRSFYRDMEHDDADKVLAYFDETVDYLAYGRKEKAFIAGQLPQYFAAFPNRSFSVGEVRLQTSPTSGSVPVTFEARYSLRSLGQTTASTGRSHVEWDLVKRDGALKIIRFTYTSYPDAFPAGSP